MSPWWEKPGMGCIMAVGGAPLAMGWGRGGGADETRGGDTPTGRGGRGSGGTAVRGAGMGAMGGMPGGKHDTTLTSSSDILAQHLCTVRLDFMLINLSEETAPLLPLCYICITPLLISNEDEISKTWSKRLLLDLWETTWLTISYSTTYVKGQPRTYGQGKHKRVMLCCMLGH